MGAKRVVPARELSLEEIQEIKDDTGLDMECFVHGALCYCYSGQCFMSSMLGGRSGNRGRCAGTCRLPFYLDGTKNTKNAYPLSLKDLCTIEHLPEILDHGVDSLKIEGRMKGSRYVGEVTRIYRKYVDLYLSEKPYKVESEDLKILMEVFNRGGFTGGYYKEYHGKDMMSMKRPDHQGLYVGKISKLMKGKISFTAQEDIHKGDALQIRINSEEKVELTSPSEFKAGSKVVLNGQKMKKLHEGMEIKRTLNHPMIERIDEGLKQKKKENLKGKIIIQKDQCAKLILKDGEDHVEVIGPVIEEAQKNGAMPADIEKLLKKTGQTHYTFEELEVDLGENLFVPGSVLKKLRKEAFAQMKTGVRILNFARGDLVNNEDLLANVASGKINKYISDFAAPELIGQENIIILPHLGASTPESEDNCAKMAVEEVCEYLENGNIINSVNFPGVNQARMSKTRLCIINKNVPNILANISKLFADHNLNIENMVNRSRGEYAYTLIDTNDEVRPDIIERIESANGIINVRAIID